MVSLSVILTLLLGIGVSYSLWNISVSQDKVNTAMTSCFDITYSSESSAINLEKQYPISDEAGSNLTPYTFKITNSCDIDAYYKINLETLNTSNIDTRFIKASLNNTNTKISRVTASTAMTREFFQRFFVTLYAVFIPTAVWRRRRLPWRPCSSSRHRSSWRSRGSALRRPP